MKLSGRILPALCHYFETAATLCFQPNYTCKQGGAGASHTKLITNPHDVITSHSFKINLKRTNMPCSGYFQISRSYSSCVRNMIDMMVIAKHFRRLISILESLDHWIFKNYILTKFTSSLRILWELTSENHRHLRLWRLSLTHKLFTLFQITYVVMFSHVYDGT